MGLALFSDLRKLSDILAQNRYLLRAAAARTGAFLAFHDLAFYRPAAGCFLWARLGGRNATATSDAALWQRFADAGVALAVGGAFHEEERGWFRITYALPSEDLDEGLRRIETALRVGRKWRPDDAGSCVQMRPGKGSKTFAGLVLMWIAGWF
jgi:DNA-binding transcriptional MocR family regulator